MSPASHARIVRTIPSEILVKEIRRRRVHLRQKRSNYQIAIDAIDRNLLLHGVFPLPTIGDEPGTAHTLKRALSFVLRGRVLTAAEAASLLPAVGYRSRSPNFTKMVRIAFLDRAVFQRVARGRYTAR